MISGYQSREFGLGFANILTPEVLDQINLSGTKKHYIRSEDVFLINGSNNKNDITDDPALIYFHTGVSNQGYWNSSHAKIQLEDMMNCLWVIYPSFDIAHLYY